jgi:hypothetical protein
MTRSSRCEVHVILGQSPPDEGRFVSGIVIEDLMHVQVPRDCGVDGVEEATEFARTMPRMTFANHSPHIQGGEERRGTVPDVVMDTSFTLPGRIGSTGALRSSA